AAQRSDLTLPEAAERNRTRADLLASEMWSARSRVLDAGIASGESARPPSMSWPLAARTDQPPDPSSYVTVQVPVAGRMSRRASGPVGGGGRCRRRCGCAVVQGSAPCPAGIHGCGRRLLQCVEEVDALLGGGGEVAPEGEERFGLVDAAEAARDFLVDFHH